MKQPYRVGEYVELPTNGRGRVRGLIHESWTVEGVRYLRLYSYAMRTIATYRIDRRGRLKKLPEPREPAETLDTGLPTAEPPKPPRGILIPFVAAILLGFMVLPLIQGGFGMIQAGVTTYEGFLKSELSLGRLVSTVANRVSYRPDIDDYWSAPEDVWQSRNGDCEDQAMVVAAYLSHHGIEHTLLGLSLKSGLQGHVVVVVTDREGPILLDPTGATAPAGIRRYAPGTQLSEVVSHYATLPARVYPPNPEAGRPEPIGVVE